MWDVWGGGRGWVGLWELIMNFNMNIKVTTMSKSFPTMLANMGFLACMEAFMNIKI